MLGCPLSGLTQHPEHGASGVLLLRLLPLTCHRLGPSPAITGQSGLLPAERRGRTRPVVGKSLLLVRGRAPPVPASTRLQQPWY
jgi:hypothetical protein